MRKIFDRTFENSHSEEEFISIYECNPQKRIIFTDGYKSYLRFEFHYLYFVTRCIKYKDKYLYGGLWRNGLSLCCSKTKLTSFEDPINLLPMEQGYNGAICADHKYDNKIFQTREELELFVINSWWKLIHSFYGLPNIEMASSATDVEGYKKIYKGKISMAKWLNLNIDILKTGFASNPRLKLHKIPPKLLVGEIS